MSGYASSSSGAGLYNSNSYQGQNYGSKYPYSNQYTGYVGGSSGPGPFIPAAPFANPFELQNAYQQYFNQLSAYNAKYELKVFIFGEYLKRFLELILFEIIKHLFVVFFFLNIPFTFRSLLRQLTTSNAGDGASVSAKASLGPSKYKNKKINE